MKRLLALAVLATPALASHAAENWKSFEATLAPRQSHEECMRLEKGDARKHHWKSDQAVDFNIHYHEGEKVQLPVKRDGMRGDGGTFTAKVPQDYCWMWTARERPAKIEGRIEVKPE